MFSYWVKVKSLLKIIFKKLMLFINSFTFAEKYDLNVFKIDPIAIIIV